MKGQWKNKKNGKTYLFLNEAINTTNENDGQIMVHYTDAIEKFVREKKEFSEKFEPVEKGN